MKPSTSEISGHVVSKMRSLVLCFLTVLAACSALGQVSSYCSLRIAIQASPPQLEPEVRVTEPNGAQLRSRTTGGIVSFCSLGIRPVTVSVGDTGCNQVILNNVPMRWRQTVELRIIYDITPCRVEQIPAPACSMLVRVYDDRGEPIPNARMDAESPRDRVIETDALGRMLVLVPLNQSLNARVYAKGYSDASIHLACRSGILTLEEKIVLSSPKPQR